LIDNKRVVSREDMAPSSPSLPRGNTLETYGEIQSASKKFKRGGNLYHSMAAINEFFLFWDSIGT
jgi:hypothetical protein